MKQTTKVLLSAVLTIALCLSVISGATFALFTSESSTNIAVNAGTVEVNAEIVESSLATSSMGVPQEIGKFATGGTAELENGTLTLDKIVPGDKVTFDIKVTNSSNVTVAFRTIVDTIADNGLFNGLKVTVGNNTPYTGFTATAWTTETAAFERIIPVTIELPTDAGNEYQGKSCTLNYKVEAVQGNGVDNAYLTVKDGVYQINNATDLKIFSMLVNSGKINETNFNTLATETTIPNGVKAELTTNITNVGPFTPIGTEKNYFVGTFDGNGYTVSGLQVNVNSGAGLFGYAGRYNQLGFQNRLKAEIKNVTVENANIVSNHYAGGIVGYIYGDVVDCTVKNSSVVVVPEIVDGVYDNGDKAGGIAGFADWCNITGNTVDTVLVFAYRDLGGVVGILAANADASLDASVVDLNTVTGGSVAYVTGYVCPNDEQKNISAVVGRQATAVDVIQNNQYATTVNDEYISNNLVIIEKDDATALQEALANGQNVVLEDDVKMESATTAPYGNKYGIKQDGGIIDGNGNELYMECYGDDYGIMTSGGTIKNLTIQEGCRAVMIMYPTQDIILDNVKIGGNGVLYPINTGESGAKGVDLIVTNSTLAGWTSFGNIESASFTNVKFEQGTYYNNIYGRVLKPYVSTTLTNCSFTAHMNLDLSSLAEGQKVTFVDCTVNGQAVTADVFTIPTSDEQYDTALFTVDLPSWATTLADCVVFSQDVTGQENLQTSVNTPDAYIQLDKGTYTFPSSIAEGVTIECAEGTVFEGTSGLNIKGATVIGATFSNPDDVAVKGTINGTFKNCTFEGSEALRWCYSEAGETVVFENCVIKTDFRGVHFDGMKGNVIFKNCEINGFNAIGGEGTVTFEGCTFGNDASRYNGLNMYSNINLIDCTFNYVSGKTNFIDMEGTGKTLKITNCTATLDGVATDIANFVGGSKLAQNTVIYN